MRTFIHIMVLSTIQLQQNKVCTCHLVMPSLYVPITLCTYVRMYVCCSAHLLYAYCFKIVVINARPFY